MGFRSKTKRYWMDRGHFYKADVHYEVPNAVTRLQIQKKEGTESETDEEYNVRLVGLLRDCIISAKIQGFAKRTDAPKFTEDEDGEKIKITEDELVFWYKERLDELEVLGTYEDKDTFEYYEFGTGFYVEMTKLYGGGVELGNDLIES